MSCSLRDAAALEALDVPTVIFANDVFRPIAYGTGDILGLSREYVEKNVVFFSHPTSNLTRAQIAALVDDRAETVVRALLGTREWIPADRSAGAGDAEATSVESLLDRLRATLREDGADLTLGALRDGVLHARLDVDEAACADGSCVLPRPNIVALIEATLRERYGGIRVVLDDSRERVA
ncbi:MAG: hypothetical protein NVSMB19_22500 [Vulcanimicrobiaceae bacterium]